MPKQKDLKRLVRTRMQKTGESYTAARLQILKKTDTPTNYAALAGMSDEAVRAKTGRSWAEWVRVLDTERAVDKRHGEIAKFVSSLGTPNWWSQMVTVGYERIRGLRQPGQRVDGWYEASKSRTFAVPVQALFDAFADARIRRQWLPATITVRTAIAPKSMRVSWENGTTVAFWFLSKGRGKSAVALAHQKLRDKPTAEAMKKMWGGYLDRLGEVLAP
jgi:hypothetical protein